MFYCYAPSTTVEEGPRSLPQTWTDPQTGIQYTNLPSLSDPELLVLGWYPYVEIDPGAPGPYYDRTFSDFSINPTTVSRNVTYTQWDIERVRNLKNQELDDQIRQYTTNEQAINPKVNEYINDDAEWLANEQAKLARLSDWQAVADFDTSKPMVLSLPNSYVGARNVRQGTALTAQNTAAVDSGLAPVWDQLLIDSYVTGNQAAADDASNSTPAVKPAYQIRQPVANVSEQFNRIVIYRFDRSDPNPALQRSFAMRMTNRQDNRNLYVFTYTNSTYLAWHLFEDPDADNVWTWEAHTSEMQYTDTDMGFIFSYSTNPAVEADYFTDRVEFPAGVPEQSILVSWDPA